MLTLEVVTPVPPLATGNAVPDNVIANVPVVVIGEPETDKNDGTVAATLVTVPEPPLGAAHEPSPRQKVDADADVPLFRLVTGKLPVTCVARSTFANVPPRVKLPLVVTVPVSVMPLTVPVPPTLVTVPDPLPLNVVQSVEVK